MTIKRRAFINTLLGLPIIAQVAGKQPAPRSEKQRKPVTQIKGDVMIIPRRTSGLIKWPLGINPSDSMFQKMARETFN